MHGRRGTYPGGLTASLHPQRRAVHAACGAGYFGGMRRFCPG